MKTVDFDFELPEERIAQFPSTRRDGSRLLVLHRNSEEIEHRQFVDLVDYLRAGDVLVLNDSRVIRARLRGNDVQTGKQFEILLLEENATNDWWAMMRPGKYAGLGKNILLMNNTGTLTKTHATVIGINADGHRRLCFNGTQNLISMLDHLGEVPLPPYITRNTDNDSNEDASRYQTVFAKANGSIAAPTAGLHFTNELMESIRARGVKVCFVTLHVGAGTFAPVKTELIAEHRMHEERFEFTDETRTAIRECKRAGNRVIAVGTTSLRVLESIAASEHKSNKEDSPKGSDSQPLSETLSGTLSGKCASDKVPDKGPQTGGWVQALVSSSSDNSSAPSALSSKSYTGKTRIFIHPPYNFRIVDVLLTNFHLPRSTLLMLVSAFASPGKTTGRELILNAYSEAIREHYRFFSYGDAMLIM